MLTARQPVLENSFCKHDRTQTTPYVPGSPIVCPAGMIVTIAGCDGETTVVKGMDSCNQVPFGLLMQEIITVYDRRYISFYGQHPRDKGTSREFPGGPVAVAHGGIWSTTIYDTDVQINAGDRLYASASGTLVKSTGWGMCASGTNAASAPVAIALNTMTTTRLAQGRQLHILSLI
jgi:hypothetical protein